MEAYLQQRGMLQGIGTAREASSSPGIQKQRRALHGTRPPSMRTDPLDKVGEVSSVRVLSALDEYQVDIDFEGYIQSALTFK